MIDRLPRSLFVVALCAAGGLTGSAQAQDTPGPATGADALVVQVSGVQNRGGRVGCSLYRVERGFPMENQHAWQSVWVERRGARAECRFENVPPGRYAVAVMHDANRNGELDRNLFGAPTEGWGVSNNASAGPFSPPSFQSARFRYAGTPIRIRMNY